MSNTFIDVYMQEFDYDILFDNSEHVETKEITVNLLRELTILSGTQLTVSPSSYLAFLPFKSNPIKCGRNATVESDVALVSNLIQN